MRILQLQQQSPAWLAWREKGLGSSDAAVVVLGRHFERDRRSLWEEKVGLSPREGMTENWAMRRGKDTEAASRKWYESVMGVHAEPVCALHEEHDWLKASYDGHVAGLNLPVEIKYASRERHEKALAGTVPAEYQPQLNHQLLVAGASVAHYVSYNPRFPLGSQYALVEYRPTSAVLQEQFDVCERFWACVRDRRPPLDSEFPASPLSAD